MNMVHISTQLYSHILKGSNFKTFILLDRRYEEFLGIPYAQPPIANFRFAEPEIPLPWSSVKDASDYGTACIQIIAPIHQIIGLSPESEDCLFINVHVPGGIDIIGYVFNRLACNLF